MAACGLCHSDDHVAKADGKVSALPVLRGHEGAGVMEEVGPACWAPYPATHRDVVYSELWAVSVVCERHAELCDSGA